MSQNEIPQRPGVQHSAGDDRSASLQAGFGAEGGEGRDPSVIAVKGEGSAESWLAMFSKWRLFDAPTSQGEGPHAALWLAMSQVDDGGSWTNSLPSSKIATRQHLLPPAPFAAERLSRLLAGLYLVVVVMLACGQGCIVVMVHVCDTVRQNSERQKSDRLTIVCMCETKDQVAALELSARGRLLDLPPPSHAERSQSDLSPTALLVRARAQYVWGTRRPANRTRACI